MIRKLILSALLVLVCAVGAFATNITVGGYQINSWQRPGTTAQIRIWYSQNFVDSLGQPVLGGAVLSSSVYKIVNCTVSGNTVTVPSFVLVSTNDSSVPNARATGLIFDSSGARIAYLFTNWIIPYQLGANPTFAQLNTYNAASPIQPAPAYPTTDQVLVLINAAVGTLSDASITVKGRTKLSVAPVSPSNPIAVGDNDSRVTADQAANVASIRKIGTGPLDAAAGNDSRIGKIGGVSVSGTPSVGQAPIATGSTTATWQTVGGGGIPCPAGSVDITAPPYNADNTGVTDASSPFQDALNAGVKNVCFPARTQGTEGVYLFDPAARGHGGAFDMTTAQGDDVNIFASGPVRLKLPANVTLANNINFIALVNGKSQSVHGFNFDGNTSVSGGAFSVSGVAIGTKSYNSRVYDNRFFHFIGLNTAGSGLVTTYNGGDSATNISTTLGTIVTAGSRTVTPASMDGIYIGRQLTIDGGTGSSELIFVTDITRATFTAPFANSHPGTATVTARAAYWQEATIENNYFYDNYGATALVINSRGNRILNNTVVKIGLNGNQHGIYVQGGDNLIQGNWLEGVYGYTFHQYSTGDGATDMSGNKYIGNWSIDPTSQHMIVETAQTNAGGNPLFPVNSSLDRYVTVTGNHFIKRSGNFSTTGTAGVELRVPAIVTDNVFFDTTTNNAGTGSPAYEYLTVFSYSTVTGNIFGSVADLTNNIAAEIINGRDPAGGTCEKACNVTVTGNTFNHLNASVLIFLGLNASITNNTVNDIPNDPASLPTFAFGANSVVTGNVGRNMGKRFFVAANNYNIAGTYIFANPTDGPDGINNLLTNSINFTTAGTGTIVKSPDGLTCKKIGIDNAGALLLSAAICP